MHLDQQGDRGDQQRIRRPTNEKNCAAMIV